MRHVLANDETLGIYTIHTSHAHARFVLRDTNGLRVRGMLLNGNRERREPRAGDVQRVLIDDRL
jgi:hypothetical protein